eukprot:417531-Prymnesium_polylepis.1
MGSGLLISPLVCASTSSARQTCWSIHRPPTSTSPNRSPVAKKPTSPFEASTATPGTTIACERRALGHLSRSSSPTAEVDPSRHATASIAPAVPDSSRKLTVGEMGSMALYARVSRSTPASAYPHVSVWP